MRLAELSNLVLTFDAFEQHFEFEFERSYPIFAPGASIKMAGRVSMYEALNTQICPIQQLSQLPRQSRPAPKFFANNLTARMSVPHPKGNGYEEVQPPDILSFSSPKNDAAITFINSTAVNGVLFQHGHTFDVVASAELLVVTQNPA